MPQHNSFFSLAEMKQPVNQWICVAFLGILCFWFLLFILTSNALEVAGSYTGNITY